MPSLEGMKSVAKRPKTPMLLTLLRSPLRVVKFFFSRKTPVGPKLLALLAVAYAIWPVDLIPDVAPVLGWLDDAGLATLALGWVMKKVSEMEDGEGGANAHALTDGAGQDATAALTSS